MSSSPGIHWHRRTTWAVRYERPCTRRCGLLTDQAERTIFERPCLSGSLRSSFSVHKLAKSVVDHEHFISLTSVRVTVQRRLDNQSDELRTSRDLSYGHLDLLLYEVI